MSQSTLRLRPMNPKQFLQSRMALIEAIWQRQDELYQKLKEDPQNPEIIKKLEFLENFQMELDEDQMMMDHLEKEANKRR